MMALDARPGDEHIVERTDCPSIGRERTYKLT
jgi:hypothetical protein